jgi:hypothetical protein
MSARDHIPLRTCAEPAEGGVMSLQFDNANANADAGASANANASADAF